MIDPFSSLSGIVRRLWLKMPEHAESEPGELFSQCKFIIVRDETLGDAAATKVCYDCVLRIHSCC